MRQRRDPGVRPRGPATSSLARQIIPQKLPLATSSPGESTGPIPPHSSRNSGRIGTELQTCMAPETGPHVNIFGYHEFIADSEARREACAIDINGGLTANYVYILDYLSASFWFRIGSLIQSGFLLCRSRSRILNSMPIRCVLLGPFFFDLKTQDTGKPRTEPTSELQGKPSSRLPLTASGRKHEC